LFNGNYALLYDSFHANKDYSIEIQSIVNSLGLEKFSNLIGLDFGCGTGLHASEFSKIGIRVDGFDRSEDMLAVARKRNSGLRFSSNLQDFKEEYDFSYSLFDVLSYQVTEEDALDLMRELFVRTKSNGYVLLDSWNSAGVLQDPPKLTERTVESSLGAITRKVIPDLSGSEEDIYPLTIQLIHQSSNEILMSELHLVRAWSPRKVEDLMLDVGFKDISVLNLVRPNEVVQNFEWRFGIKAKKP
jgi:SAM-dependent methyltransferase